MSTPTQEYPNLALIRQGTEYRFVLKLRGLSLVMRPLSIQEEDQITQEVIEAMKPLDIENRTGIRQASLLSIKKLAKANTSDVGAQDGKIHEVELQRLTPGELDHLFNSTWPGATA